MATKQLHVRNFLHASPQMCVARVKHSIIEIEIGTKMLQMSAAFHWQCRLHT